MIKRGKLCVDSILNEMKTSRNIKIENILIVFFVCVTFFALLYRISIHCDVYDEIINLNISYRIALGDIPFYNCWEAFQSGDVLMAFFIWIYMKIFKTTSGIVLYSRIIYVITLLSICFIAYVIFKQTLNKKSAFLLSYIVVFFNLYSLFYLWYDTVSVLMLFLGGLLLFQGMMLTKRIRRRVLFFLSGIIHYVMAFSYPSFAILAIIIAMLLCFILVKVKMQDIKNSILDVLFYVLGAFFVFLLCILYVEFTVGLSQWLDTFQIVMGTRSANSFDFLEIVTSILTSYMIINKFMVFITIILFIIFFTVLEKKISKSIFVCSLIVLPVFNQFFLEKNAYMGLSNYLALLMFFCPCVYHLLEEKKEEDKTIFYLLYLPSVMSLLLISLTTVFTDIGPVKCWQASLSGAIATLYYSVKVMSNCKKNNVIAHILLAMVSITLLYNSYSYIYLNQPYIKFHDKRIESGIYKGIKSNENMHVMEEIQKKVECFTNDKETIMAGSRLRPVYMMSKLKPYVWSVESPMYYLNGTIYWDNAIKYFEYFGDLPDIIVIEKYEIENDEIKELLNEYYDKVLEQNFNDMIVCIFVEKKAQ